MRLSKSSACMSQFRGIRSLGVGRSVCRGGCGLAVGSGWSLARRRILFWREKGIISDWRLFNIQSREVVGRGGKRQGVERGRGQKVENGFKDMVQKQWCHKKSPEHFLHCGNNPIRAEHKLPMINACVPITIILCLCMFLLSSPALLALTLRTQLPGYEKPKLHEEAMAGGSVWQLQLINQLTSRLNSQIC